jgi:predicted esterase
MKLKFLLPAFFFLFTLGNVQAQYSGSGLNWPTWKYDSLFYKSVANENTLMPYRLLKPLTYVPGNRTVKYPLVIMLHGKGEGMGSSWADNVGINITQLGWGGKMHLDSLSKYPAFYLHPQTFQGGWSSADGSGDYDPEGSRPMRILTELLDSLFRQHPIDIDRVYIHGLSGGGQGVWEMLFRNPALFAATSPHSATGNLNAAQQIVHNPLWVSQGELDTNPRPENAIKMMDSLKKYGVYPIFTWNTTLKKHVWPNVAVVDGNPIYSSNPNLAHVAWIDLYNSPVWLKWMFSQNKNNIKVFDNGDRGICADGSDNRRIGISPGFEEYEWSKNGVVIPNSNTNDLIVSEAGDYRVRHKRKEFYFSGPSVWSDWSAPVTIYYKTVSSLVTTISPVGSIALPSLDGKTNVQLNAAGTFTKYLWSTGETTSSITVNALGTYTVKVSEAGKCAGPASNGITVTINGIGPAAPANFAGSALNESSTKLTWSDVSSDESGFEIYRATISGGPYTLAGITTANATTFEDTKLKHVTNYYYKIRGYNNNGGSSYSPEVLVKTLRDLTPPTAPQNLVASEKTLSSALLSWTASEDLSGIKRYEIFKNGVKLATVAYTKTSYTATALGKDSLFISGKSSG